MKDITELTVTTPEISMKHYDSSVTSSEGRQQQDMAAKQASFEQAVGYPVTPNISAQDWEDQVHRNKISKSRGGLYVQKADPVRCGCNSF